MRRGQQTTAAFITASALLREVHDAAPSDRFTLEWLLRNFSNRSNGAIILLFAIAALIPGISVPAGLLLLVTTVQMIVGRDTPTFPRWIAARPLPSDKLRTALGRAIPVLSAVETAVHPRWPMPANATRCIVGLVLLLLTVRLLTFPLPLSNVLPAALIGFVALAYLEADGVMLTIGLFLGVILLVADAKLLYDLARSIFHWG